MRGPDRMLPCPFCGCCKHLFSAYARDGQRVGCGPCGASVIAFEPNSEAKAIDTWNTRYPVQP